MLHTLCLTSCSHSHQLYAYSCRNIQVQRHKGTGYTGIRRIHRVHVTRIMQTTGTGYKKRIEYIDGENVQMVQMVQTVQVSSYGGARVQLQSAGRSGGAARIRNVLGAVVEETAFEKTLDKVAQQIVGNHECSQSHLKAWLKGDETQPCIDLRNKLG